MRIYSSSRPAHFQPIGKDQVKTNGPISEQKLRANRANAKRSTGPKTEAGKAVSRRNALKHGILSRSLDLPSTIPSFDLPSVKLDGLFASAIPGTDSAPKEISALWDKLAKVLAFEKECLQRTGGLGRYGLLIQRYERMLTRQLHARIRERSDLSVTDWKRIGRSL